MSEGPIFNYAHYEPDKHYGARDFAVDETTVSKWRSVYPHDDDLGVMPAGMLAILAEGLNVGIREAGLLVTFGAIILCFGSPVMAWLTTRIGIPSFLTTLAMMGIAKGIAMWISATAAVPILSPGYAWLFGGGNVGPVPVLLFLIKLVGRLR